MTAGIAMAAAAKKAFSRCDALCRAGGEAAHHHPQHGGDDQNVSRQAG
jgi:hypothetical protein